MKILIADDDNTTAKLLSKWVETWGYDVVRASDGKEALEILDNDPEIQLCILDWLMPYLTGPEICRILREREDENYRYCILLTAKTKIEDVVLGIEAGADDYLIKPCNPLELDVRVRAGWRVLDLQKRLLAVTERLRREATHDALTGLMNRRAISDVLENQMARVERGGQLAVVMVDLDHFKRINDTHGHLVGDVVLKESSNRIKKTLRQYDHASRYGGEEYLLLLND